MKKQLRGSISRLRGINSEHLALCWLRDQGLLLLARNYRCKGGEIDLVMRDQDTLVFIEVRYRYWDQYGGSLESVDWRKQKKLLLAARHFLMCHKQFQHMPCRFDVLAGKPGNNTGNVNKPDWQWIKNAISS